MRILDQDTDRSCNRIVMFLTRSEANELRDSLEALIAAAEMNRHEHVTSSDQRKEITVCLYGETSLEGFDERSRTLLQFDR